MQMKETSYTELALEVTPPIIFQENCCARYSIYYYYFPPIHAKPSASPVHATCHLGTAKSARQSILPSAKVYLQVLICITIRYIVK